MHYGDRVYFKPWNCLLDTIYTCGMSTHAEYAYYENNILTVTRLDDRHNYVNVNNNGWHFDENIIDKNRKVI